METHPTWTELTKRFRNVPANSSVTAVREPAQPGAAIRGAHARPILALAFSADSRLLAVSGGGRIPGPADVRVFDVATRELRYVCTAHTMGVFDLAFDAKGAWLASASHDYAVNLWSLTDRDVIMMVGGADVGISRGAVAIVGTRLLIGDGMTWGDEVARLFSIDFATGEERTLITCDPGIGVSRLALLPGATHAVVETTNMRDLLESRLRLVRLEDARVEADRAIANGTFDMVASRGSAIGISLDAETSETTELWALDLASGERRVERALGEEISGSLALSPDGAAVAIGYHQHIELAPVETLRATRTLDLGTEHAVSVAWSPDGQRIAVGTLERTVRLFDAITGSEQLAGQG